MEAAVAVTAVVVLLAGAADGSGEDMSRVGANAEASRCGLGQQIRESIQLLNGIISETFR